MTTTGQGVDAIVRMPSLGDSVDEGIVTRWLKAPGEHVDIEEPLLEVATDKVDTEIPAPCSGRVARLLAEEGDVVAVGAELAVITAEADSVSEVGDPAAPILESPGVEAVSVPAEPDTPTLATVNGEFGTIEKLPRIRRTIARRMTESLHVAAQLTTVVEVDLSAVARLRATYKDEFQTRAGAKLTFLPFFAKAAIEALPEHRMLNASLNTEVTEVTYHDPVHLGVAVDGPKGLMVPVIRDAQTMSIADLARAIAELAGKVRSGQVTADELTGGTFTITNTGGGGALFDTPILNPPETGILGTGAVVERLVPVRDGNGGFRIELRPMAYFSITYDHRIVDGADAARYLGATKRRIESGFTAEDLSA